MRTQPVPHAPNSADTAPLPVVDAAQLYPSPHSGLPATPPYAGGPPGAAGPYIGPPRARRSPALGYVLKGLGLTAVAVVSGLVWLAFQPVPGKPTALPSGAPGGQFTFVKQPPDDTTSDCQAHSFSAVSDFFADTPCEQLIRSLYTTTTNNGAKVVVSLAVVHMSDADAAAQLKTLVEKDGTGNVRNLVWEGRTFPGGPTKLGSAGFKAAQKGPSVTIVEAGYFDAQHNDDPLLITIAADALRLAG